MANPVIAAYSLLPGKLVLETAGPTPDVFTLDYTGPDASATLEARLSSALAASEGRIMAALAGLSSSAVTVGAPPPVPLTNPTAYAPGWTALTLTPADDIGKAVAAAGKGFKLALATGRYTQVFNVPPGLDGWEIASASGKAADVTLDGGGGLTVAQNNAAVPGTPGRLASGKGVVHAASPGHVHDLTITGGGLNAKGDHDGQAGLYWECSNGECSATRVIFRGNQNGAFGNEKNVDVHYVFDTCLFEGNGTDGGSHDTYVCAADTTTSRATYLGCHAEGSNSGNNFKSRLPFVDIVGGWHGSKNANRWLDCADGAVLTIKGGTFVANDIGQNVFGNGTESTTKGPGNTTWDGSTIYIGNRPADFCNAGTFVGTNLKVLWTGPNGAIFNSAGTPLTGFPAANPGAGFVPYPRAPAYD